MFNWVFADVLMRITEVHHIRYDTFTSLAIYSTKLDTVMQFGKTLFRTPGWRVKFTMAWLLISTAYLATFPSLVDVMSGYEASYLPQLNLPSGTSKVMNDTIFSEFDNRYRYSDKNLPMTSFFNTTFMGNMTLAEYRSEHRSDYPFVYHWYDPDLDKEWSDSVNISASYSGRWYASRVRDLLYIEQSKHYSCVIDPNIYHWGFSAGWIIAVASVNSAWLIGLWIIWVDADHNSQLCRKGRRMGVYRGMVDIAEAIKENLGTDLCAYSEAELAAAVKRQGPIKYYVSDVEDGQPGHIGLSSRQSAKVKLSWEQKRSIFDEIEDGGFAKQEKRNLGWQKRQVMSFTPRVIRSATYPQLYNPFTSMDPNQLPNITFAAPEPKIMDLGQRFQ
ncbi:MAG: hypothetical protein Q9187_001085 [Circinaria calcarea]